jgi:two-component system sensor histidine kinase DesK
MTPLQTRTVRRVRVVAGLGLLPLLLSTVVQLRGSSSGLEITTSNQAWTPLAPAIVVASAMLYVLYWVKVWPHEHGARTPMLLLAAMATLAVVDAVIFGPTNDLWLYVAVVAGCALPPRRAVAAVLLITVAATAATLLPLGSRPGQATSTVDTGHAGGPITQSTTARFNLPGLSVRLSDQLSAATVAALPLLIAGLGTVLVAFLSRNNRQLRAARVLQVQLAAQEERTRVARDLHDTLGRSLSLMAVKLQVAEHLVETGDPQAGAEVGEVRRLALHALRDVRDTVSGYRQPTIVAELSGARIALTAAGITAHLRDHHGVLAPEVEAACGWIIREATTNVLKHSGARTCSIDLERVNGDIIVSVLDDGPTDRPNGTGFGLQGLRERVDALGGALLAQPASPGPGFQLRARIPVHPTASGHVTD